MRFITEDDEESGLDYVLMDREYVVEPLNATAEEVKAAFDNKDNYRIS